MTVQRVTEPISVMSRYKMTGEVVIKIKQGEIVSITPKRTEDTWQKPANK